MKIAITKPSAGAGRWCWQGFENAFRALGHEVREVGYNPALIHTYNPDLLITSTSLPSQEYLNWRNRNPDAKVALNVLAWTTVDDQWVNKPGVQASPNNVQYAKDIKANIVFAQYSKAYRTWLMDKWANEGFKLGSMEMAADSIAYEFIKPNINNLVYDIVYVGSRWPYKAENLDKYIGPLLMKYSKSSYFIGKGWHIPTNPEKSEWDISKLYASSKISLNAHEPHSTNGHFDVVERLFKIMYCGGLCCSDYVKEIEEGFNLINNIDLILSKADEYIDTVEMIIKNPENYHLIRYNGQINILKNHLYLHRAINLLSDLEFNVNKEQNILNNFINEKIY